MVEISPGSVSQLQQAMLFREVKRLGRVLTFDPDISKEDARRLSEDMVFSAGAGAIEMYPQGPCCAIKDFEAMLPS